MKKNLYLHALLISLFISSSLTAQPAEIKISETGYTEICGKMVMIDGIWMSEGIMRADISILETPNSKPITGGYKKGDEITISSKDSCTYYIFSLTKTGAKDSKGTVVFSKTPPLNPVQVCEDNLTFYEAKSYKIDSLDWNVASIKDGDKGLLQAEIKITHNTSSIDNLFLRENDNIWLGECLYSITHLNKSLAISKGNKWKLDEGKIILKKVSDYSYSTDPVIKGEDINKPIEK